MRVHDDRVILRGENTEERGGVRSINEAAFGRPTSAPAAGEGGERGVDWETADARDATNYAMRTPPRVTDFCSSATPDCSALLRHRWRR
jgi:hypothetical protein